MHLAQEESPQRKSECIQLTDVGREEEAAESGGREEGEKAKSLVLPFVGRREAEREREREKGTEV